MARGLVIFGTGQIAELANFYFANDSMYEVAGFTVDDAYATATDFAGLPVVPFSQVMHHFPPRTHDLFVAIGYSKLNRLRVERFRDALALGYELASYLRIDCKR